MHSVSKPVSCYVKREKKMLPQDPDVGLDPQRVGSNSKPSRGRLQPSRWAERDFLREEGAAAWVRSDFWKKSEQAIQSLLRRGAGGGTRTRTVSPPTDFESVTSTNSITPACWDIINHYRFFFKYIYHCVIFCSYFIKNFIITLPYLKIICYNDLIKIIKKEA